MTELSLYDAEKNQDLKTSSDGSVQNYYSSNGADPIQRSLAKLDWA
jgi:hypothetical protein